MVKGVCKKPKAGDSPTKAYVELRRYQDAAEDGTPLQAYWHAEGDLQRRDSGKPKCGHLFFEIESDRREHYSVHHVGKDVPRFTEAVHGVIFRTYTRWAHTTPWGEPTTLPRGPWQTVHPR